MFNRLRSTARALDGDLFALGALCRVVVGVRANSGGGVGNVAGGVHLGEMGKGGFQLELFEPGSDLAISMKLSTVRSMGLTSR